MSNITDALARARSDAQELHKKIQASASKDHAAIQTDLKNAGESAKKLATSLKTAVDGQRGDAVEHIKQAATKLDDAAKGAQSAVGATEAHVKEQNRAMLDKVRDALQNLSEAAATQRAKMVKA